MSGPARRRGSLSEAGLGRDTRRDLLAEVEWAILDRRTGHTRRHLGYSFPSPEPTDCPCALETPSMTAQKTSAIESGKAGSWNRFTGPRSSKNAPNDQMTSANRVPRATIPGGQADRIER